jgi:hypothetical protein
MAVASGAGVGVGAIGPSIAKWGVRSERGDGQ